MCFCDLCMITLLCDRNISWKGLKGNLAWSWYNYHIYMCVCVCVNIHQIYLLMPQSHHIQYWGPFHERFFHRYSNSLGISFCSHPSYSKVVAMKFCTCHDSCADVACAKFCSDMIINIEVTLKPIFHWIWITMEKSFVKWGPVRALSGVICDSLSRGNSQSISQSINQSITIDLGNGLALNTLLPEPRGTKLVPGRGNSSALLAMGLRRSCINLGRY